MAFKLINKKWCAFRGEFVSEYICDADADFATLPASAIGSTALSVASAKTYMVNASGKWAELGETALNDKVMIDGSSYPMSAGMTWREFCELYPDEFTIEGDSTGNYSEDTEIVCKGVPLVKDSDGSLCLPHEVIDINEYYRVY